MLIRKFEPEDFPCVIDIERQVFNEHDPYFYMQFYETCSDGFIVAEMNGLVIGYVVGFLANEGTGRVFSLAVHPAYQGRGAGSALLKELAGIFRNFGALEIILEVRSSNTRARKFYEKHGFYQTGIVEKYYNDGENACLMRLRLNTSK
ncbi:ribosomal protein S18-alanine N-acetyltransferase [Candidatus Methanoperedens nitratireducens]|uniref:Putative enzyme n=1 Tax=Candidatus Methanoperedens nitratireducens TaxID=1392998 RepID=A0A284VKM0_9EURY|nr:ribosomal protein S18-alanine N-acetyltransferase [Candidatus Methanoperedens nitroreducens]SNQ59747.1 putative enzyme [Candidatus Methanoperedens nitroreducens]